MVRDRVMDVDMMPVMIEVAIAMTVVDTDMEAGSED
jgi:hypothetical protein